MTYQTALAPETKKLSTLNRPTLQRRCACGKPTTTNGECAECNKKKRRLQRKATNQQTPETVPPIVHEVLGEPGRPLDSATRTFMEARFGHDFSHVRIHANSKAVESAQAVHAHAFTVGNNIVFGEGNYTPNSTSGRQLLAHELTHTLQQKNNSPLAKHTLAANQTNDVHEQEAERMANQISQDKCVSPRLQTAPLSIQRAMICSRPLELPGNNFIFHGYIDDTGRNDCKGAGEQRNYGLFPTDGSFISGCAHKTDSSADPRGKSPKMKPCEPKDGVSDVSQCLRATFNSYAEPSSYSNEAVVEGAAIGGIAGGLLGGLVGLAEGSAIGGAIGGHLNGPNSNTFAATLARACCANASDSGLGWVPGWDHEPATTCSS
ncbi:MAG: DUF4157 domain-containing protein [Chloroflexi bacterium]|nr:DUF4157 domain-containing protein [Chloroflexota bacterium]